MTSQPMGYNPDEKLSSRFLLRDLTKTSYPISNIPDETQIENLKKLALMLDDLFTQIGPFQIESGFRTKELQVALSKDTPQAAANSFHVLGIAADVVPTTMSAEKWFAKLLASPLRTQLGEMALKQNTIHLSLATSWKQDVPMKVVNNQYIRLSATEVKGLIDRYGFATTVGAGLIAAAIGAGFLLTRYIQSRRATA